MSVMFCLFSYVMVHECYIVVLYFCFVISLKNCVSLGHDVSTHRYVSMKREDINHREKSVELLERKD